MLMFIYGIWFAFISPFFFKRFLSHLPPVEELQVVPEVGDDEEPLS